jgi:uncharacterized protein YkwD
MRMTIAAVAVLLTALLAGPAPAATSTTAPTTPSVERSDTSARAALSTIKKKVIALTNKKRVNHGCGRLTNNAALGRAAQKHTKKLANYKKGPNDTNGYTFGDPVDPHDLPGEPALGTRITNEGYRWSRIAENIAYGQPTPRAVVAAWMGSPPHRRNILDCRLKNIGVGYALAADGTPHWTQDFGKKL